MGVRHVEHRRTLPFLTDNLYRQHKSLWAQCKRSSCWMTSGPPFRLVVNQWVSRPGSMPPSRQACPHKRVLQAVKLNNMKFLWMSFRSFKTCTFHLTLLGWLNQGGWNGPNGKIKDSARGRSVSTEIRLRAGWPGFSSRQGQWWIFFFLYITASRPVLGPTQPPSQWVPGGKVSGEWSWPLTSI